jgi:hypothetical protein
MSLDSIPIKCECRIQMGKDLLEVTKTEYWDLIEEVPLTVK